MICAMAKDKNTGKCDHNGTPVRIGDFLKNRHTGLVYRVRKEGELRYKTITEKRWDGDDYIIQDESIGEDEKRCSYCGRILPKSQFVHNSYCRECHREIALAAMRKRRGEGSASTAEPEAKPELEQPAVNPNPAIEEALDEVLCTAEEISDALLDISDETLVAELRRRGIDVKATKTITIEL